jgi:2-polyprenyl-6-methoxyphenol hydroxylase-like FAD-dependent oxidoreductase
LHDAAKEAGATILFSSPVDAVNADTSEVIFNNGNSLGADLIVGADG